MGETECLFINYFEIDIKPDFAQQLQNREMCKKNPRNVFNFFLSYQLIK